MSCMCSLIIFNVDYPQDGHQPKVLCECIEDQIFTTSGYIPRSVGSESASQAEILRAIKSMNYVHGLNMVVVATGDNNICSYGMYVYIL